MNEPIGTSRTPHVRRAIWIACALCVPGILLLLRLASANSSSPGSAPASAPASVAASAPASAPAGTAQPRSSDDSPDREPPASARRVALGHAIFFDTALSEPPGTSCASCHDPARAFAGNHGSTRGVALGSRPGHFAQRNTPSVLYLKFVRRLHPHWEEDAPLVDIFGGFFWDGRVDSLSELVKQPLLNPDEMNGGSPARLRDKMRSAAYAADLRGEFGDAVDEPNAALAAMGDAVRAYLLSPEMSPFSSKYDDYIRGRAAFTPLEARGLALFKDSAKGGCAGCHKLNDNLAIPERSLFTDYGYDAAAPPRNPRLSANRDPGHFDLGLCKRPDTHYHTDDRQFCGTFRTPSLRNVAVRPAFMHNGVFSRLRDVVAFYATRATDPGRWYKSGVTFDDVPKEYRQNVNVEKAPYNRHIGQRPALDEAEIDAIVAFLGTLTDAQYR